MVGFTLRVAHTIHIHTSLYNTIKFGHCPLRDGFCSFVARNGNRCCGSGFAHGEWVELLVEWGEQLLDEWCMMYGRAVKSGRWHFNVPSTPQNMARNCLYSTFRHSTAIHLRVASLPIPLLHDMEYIYSQTIRTYL